eukprot:3909789-Lingulodinium_polyedra.AAC.1
MFLGGVGSTSIPLYLRKEIIACDLDISVKTLEHHWKDKSYIQSMWLYAIDRGAEDRLPESEMTHEAVSTWWRAEHGSRGSLLKKFDMTKAYDFTTDVG